MNPRQAIAFANPCFEAEETMDNRFFSYEWEGERLFTSILSANHGFE